MPRTVLQASENMRKAPRQQRATQTVDAILEAAAQILQSDGDERLTTNHIAERAGCSIGTLYQYFPDKDAIIAAIAERERQKILAAIIKALQDVEPRDADAVVRGIIRTLVGAFSRRRRARRIITMMMLRRWQVTGDRQGADEIAALLVNSVGHARNASDRPISPVTAFVLTRAIVGAIRAAVLENSPWLESPEFEDELVRLARQFLRP
jgi:AcrR family transcriptional regulator